MTTSEVGFERDPASPNNPITREGIIMDPIAIASSVMAVSIIRPWALNAIRLA